MKSSRMIVIVAAMMMVSLPINAILMGNPKNNALNLTYCLSHKVDNNGQTLLHALVNNCDNDGFKVSIELFNFIEKELPALNAEDSTLGKKIVEFKAISNFSEELAMLLLLKEVGDYMQIKDNNGDTALDIAKRRNELNPHERCRSCIELLEIFDGMNKVEKAE